MPEHILLLLITGCFMLQPISTDLYLASLPHLVTEFQVTPAVVAQTLSLFTIGFGVAQLISGPLSDRFGRRPILLGGLGIYIVASLACALSPSITLLIAARFLQAVGCCTGLVVSRAVIRDCYTPAEGAQRIARVSNYMGYAVISGPIVGAQLQAHFGWRAAFVLHALLSAATLVFAWHSLEETNRNKNPAATALPPLLKTYLDVARTPAFWAYALAGSLGYGTIFVFISGASFGFIKVLGISTANYGYCFSLGCAGYLSGSFLCRRLLPRIGMEKTVDVGAKLMLAAGLSFLLTTAAGIQHWLLLILFQFGCMFSHGLIFPAAQAGSIAPFPQKAGAAAGFFGAFSIFGALVVANWIGISLDGTLWPLAKICFVMSLLLVVSVKLSARYSRIAR
ncbi:MAG: Bcr/CflA family efflux MFS transporter [Rhodocyclaceae bacterium]|nr:MAG: Bcr/CflA family efflux MFS transporter [Rhodocyclaceae bacterium]